MQKLSGRFKRMIFVGKGGCVIPAGTFLNSLCDAALSWLQADDTEIISLILMKKVQRI